MLNKQLQEVTIEEVQKFAIEINAVIFGINFSLILGKLKVSYVVKISYLELCRCSSLREAIHFCEENGLEITNF